MDFSERERKLVDILRQGSRVGMPPLTPLAVEESPFSPGVSSLEFLTGQGFLISLFHKPDTAKGSAVIWAGGAFGGLNGPAEMLYPTLATRLAGRGVSSLRIHYRKPNALSDCVFDILLAEEFLRLSKGCDRIVTVGHSFGGGVAIAAAAMSPKMAGVVAMSPQLDGTQTVEKIAPRPLLLVHGEADPILPALCSRNIHDRARDPKTLVLYPGAGHLLTECAAELRGLLERWIMETLEGSSP